MLFLLCNCRAIMAVIVLDWLPEVTDKLYHIMLYRLCRIRTDVSSDRY